FSYQRESASFNLEHVFEPGLHPTANRNVTAHLRLFGIRFRNEWRKPSTIAYAENVNSFEVDEIVILQCAKGRAISGQLRLEVCFAANAFAVAHALLVHSEQCEFRELRETAKNQAAFIFRVCRRFHGIAAQPTGHKDGWQFSIRTTRFGN